jgi:hypothetical protein
MNCTICNENSHETQQHRCGCCGQSGLHRTLACPEADSCKLCLPEHINARFNHKTEQHICLVCTKRCGKKVEDCDSSFFDNNKQTNMYCNLCELNTHNTDKHICNSCYEVGKHRALHCDKKPDHINFIKKFGEMKVTKFENDEKLTCPICMENKKQISIKNGADGCGHSFCYECVKGLITNNLNKCPNCKAHFNSNYLTDITGILNGF